MRSGRLRHKIQIQDYTAGSRDAYGGENRTWSTITRGDTWAEVKAESSSETTQGAQVGVVVTYQVRTRYIAGVKPKQRVVFGSKTLEIMHAINVDERDRELLLECRELNSDA